jgi:hypothetical protein
MDKNALKEIEDLIKKRKEAKENNTIEKLGDVFSKAIEKIKFPEKIGINNLEDIEQQEFPSSFRVENVEELANSIAEEIVIPDQKEFPSKIEISNFKELSKEIKIPKQKEFPKSFSVDNISEIKFPKTEFPENLKKLSFENVEKLTKDVYDKILLFFKAMKDGIFVSNKKPNEAIPVRMVSKDGKSFTEMKHIVTGFPAGVGIYDENNNRITPIQSSKTPYSYNITLTNVDTEYSQAIPNGAKKIQFWSRNDEDIRFSFTSGKVATPTAPYLTHKGGLSTHEGELYLTDQVIYFATDVAGDVVEMLCWT